jgi:hypothetical protein
VYHQFGTVLLIVCGISIVAAVYLLVSTGKTWEDYGKNRLVLDNDLARGAAPGSVAAILERDAEIRQLLEARNARRARRGEPPVDVEAELRRLTAPRVDAELRSEIKEFVMARNARRTRRGEPLLDVEAEIEREIAGLSGVV